MRPDVPMRQHNWFVGSVVHNGDLKELGAKTVARVCTWAPHP